MAKLLVTLSVFLALSVASTYTVRIPEKTVKNTKVLFLNSGEIDELLKKHPNAVELKSKTQTLPAQDALVAPRYILNYFLGYRVANDYRVAHDSDAYSWPQFRDVQMNIEYPSYGIGKIVSFVDIYVSQSSSYGRAYAIAGGIGYRYITVVVEAQSTYYFEYDASIYGYD